MYDKLDLTKSCSVSVLSAPYKKKASPLHRRGAGAGARRGVRVTSAPDSRGKPSALLHGYQGFAGGENQVITLSYNVPCHTVAATATWSWVKTIRVLDPIGVLFFSLFDSALHLLSNQFYFCFSLLSCVAEQSAKKYFPIPYAQCSSLLLLLTPLLRVFARTWTSLSFLLGPALALAQTTLQLLDSPPLQCQHRA